MKKSVFAVINFCYWLHNFPGLIDEIIAKVFNDQHFVNKWNTIAAGSTYAEPRHLIAFIMELSDGNKRKLIEYIENTYTYRQVEITD